MGDVNLTVVVVAFAVYTLAIVAVGLYSARFARRSDEDYFLAGRSLNSWIAALSASASSESGWVTLGLVGWAYTEGVQAYWILPGCLLGFAFNWFVIAPRMHDRAKQLNAVTVPDFFALLFRERLPLVRILSVIVIFVAMFLYVAAQFSAAGKAFGVLYVKTAGPEGALTALAPGTESGADAATDPGTEAGVSATQPAATTQAATTQSADGTSALGGGYAAGVLIGAVIVLLYTVSGGFRAVCWTDFLQALLMVGALVVFPIYLLSYFGGWSFIDTQLMAADEKLLEFTARAGVFAFIGFLFGHGALGINFGYPGQPHVLVRFMALKDRKMARLGGVIALVWGALVYWGAVTVGLFARAVSQEGVGWAQLMTTNQEIYGELGLVLAAMHMLPAVMSGLVLAAILAAICSTADSQMVVAASGLANDIYARLVKRGRGLGHTLVNRGAVLLLGVLAVIFALDQERRVYELVLTYGWAILGAAFGPQMILALMWRRATYAGCLGGMLTGFVVALAWAEWYHPGPDGIEIYNLPLAFLAALVVNVLLSLAFPSNSPAASPPARETETAPPPGGW